MHSSGRDIPHLLTINACLLCQLLFQILNLKLGIISLLLFILGNLEKSLHLILISLVLISNDSLDLVHLSLERILKLAEFDFISHACLILIHPLHLFV